MQSVKSYEHILREVPTEEVILNNERRANMFKGEDAYEYLKKKNLDEKVIHDLFNTLIDEEVIVRGLLSKNSKDVIVSLARKFNKKDSYIWVVEQTNHMHLILSVVLIAFVLLLVMYQVWPSKIRSKMTYVFYPIFAFFVFLGVLAVLRLVIFSVTFFSHPPGIWLFPNLFADVGFIDSFIPVWSYHGTETKPKKKVD